MLVTDYKNNSVRSVDPTRPQTPIVVEIELTEGLEEMCKMSENKSEKDSNVK